MYDDCDDDVEKVSVVDPEPVAERAPEYVNVSPGKALEIVTVMLAILRVDWYAPLAAAIVVVAVTCDAVDGVTYKVVLSVLENARPVSK
jgi:hypothetical protein